MLRKIADVTQIVVRIDVRTTDAVPVGERREGRHLADEPIHLQLPRFGIHDVLCLRIERRQSRNGTDQHSHRMGIIVKSIDELLDIFMGERVHHDIVGPLFVLRLCRQLAMDQQVCRFKVIALLRKLLDGISAVTENSFVAVDVRDSTDACRGIHECRVISHHAKILVADLDLAEVYGLDRIMLDGDFELFSRPVIRNSQ